MILSMSGMGVKHVPIPCKNRWLVFGSAGMNPTPLKRTIFLKNERSAEVSDLVLIVVFCSENEMLS